MASWSRKTSKKHNTEVVVNNERSHEETSTMKKQALEEHDAGGRLVRSL